MGNKTSIISIIDKGLIVDGAISSRGKLIIKGTVKGTINGDIVIIAREGAVYANTKAARMTVGGKYEGELLVSEEMIVLQTGNCSGKIVCRNLIVEVGGVLNGEIACVLPAEEMNVKKPAIPAKAYISSQTP